MVPQSILLRADEVMELSNMVRYWLDSAASAGLRSGPLIGVERKRKPAAAKVCC
jgi:hypothetical protein